MFLFLIQINYDQQYHQHQLNELSPQSNEHTQKRPRHMAIIIQVLTWASLTNIAFQYPVQII